MDYISLKDSKLNLDYNGASVFTTHKTKLNINLLWNELKDLRIWMKRVETNSNFKIISNHTSTNQIGACFTFTYKDFDFGYQILSYTDEKFFKKIEFKCFLNQIRPELLYQGSFSLISDTVSNYTLYIYEHRFLTGLELPSLMLDMMKNESKLLVRLNCREIKKENPVTSQVECCLVSASLSRIKKILTNFSSFKKIFQDKSETWSSTNKKIKENNNIHISNHKYKFNYSLFVNKIEEKENEFTIEIFVTQLNDGMLINFLKTRRKK